MAITNQPTARNAAAPTEDQFRRAYDIALLAIDKDLPELSLKAMRDGVRGGPPVNTNENRRMGGGPLTSRYINGVQYYVEGGNERQLTVDQALVTLVPKWQAKKVPTADIYAVGAALPAQRRPTEVFSAHRESNRGMIYQIRLAEV